MRGRHEQGTQARRRHHYIGGNVLTVAAVERRLFAALISDAVRVKVGPLQSKGFSIAELNHNRPERVSITVDIHQDGAITCLVHELIHFAYASEVRAWGKLEEAVVLAVEQEVYGWIERRPRLFERWRKALQAKLGE